MKISVIIPGYNNPEPFWRRCVESVLAAKPDEVICVDDGSNAKPVFLEEYPIRVIYREQNGGPALTRNTALEIASGDYVTFVDSDDEILPETFIHCRAALESSSADIAVYGVKVIWVNDGLMKTDLPSVDIQGTCPTAMELKKLSDDCLLNYQCNKVYRKGFVDEHHLRFPVDGMPCEDIIFNLKCLIAGATCCTVPFAGYIYYRTHQTILSKYKPSCLAGMRQASETWRSLKDHLPGAREVFGGYGEVDGVALSRAEKRNRLHPGSPCWWLSVPYNAIRKLLYVRFVRRWHIRWLYPQVEEWAR